MSKDTTAFTQRIPADTIILGFTGALGSGCSFFAKEIAEKENFAYFELSEILHKTIDEKNATPERLQSAGNELRRTLGANILAHKTIEEIDKEWEEKHSNKKGIIISGIRNRKEVKFLREFPNFYLFSIHAEYEKRFKRLENIKKIKDKEEFRNVDTRDKLEQFDYGQQVTLCNYESDIIINNDEDFSSLDEQRKAEYVRRKTNKYISLIYKLAKQENIYDLFPSLNETFMTAAYGESTLSSCLKRQVGAVIARIYKDKNGMENGFIVSSGHNEVPIGMKSCAASHELGKCARDKIQEEIARQIIFCPKCSEKFEKVFKCVSCNRELHEYYKTCPDCHHELDLNFVCQKCKTDIFKSVIGGAGGKFLDMCRSLHAEENAIMNMVKNSTTVHDDTVLFTTTFPCNLCANKIAEIGIKKVVFADPYPMKEARGILEHREVKLEKFEGVKSQAFFRLYQR